MQYNKWFLALMLLGASFLSYFLYIQFFSVPAASVDTNSQLLVGVNAEYPPFVYRDNGNIVGFDIDLMHEIGKKLGKEIVIKDMPFDALIPEIQLGKIQVAASGMSPTPERAKAVLFTDLYFSGIPLVIMTKVGIHIKLVDELAGKNVVVNEGFVADSYLTKMSSISMNIMRLLTVNEAILALDTGRADAFVTSLSSVRMFLQHNNNEALFSVTEIPATQEEYAFVVSKEHPDCQHEINGALELLKQEGTLELLQKKWNLL